MAEMSFSSEDIQNLGRKLDESTTGFDERERALLLTFLTLANEALIARQGEVAGFTLPVLEIDLRKPTDTSSPNLFQSACSGQPYSPNFTEISLKLI